MEAAGAAKLVLPTCGTIMTPKPTGTKRRLWHLKCYILSDFNAKFLH